MIAVQNVQETNLAWALIEVAKPHLNVLERNYVFVTTGAGDTFAAIHDLLKLIAAKGIPLRPSLVRLCVTWLDSYAFHDEEPYLRRLIEGFLLPDAIRALTAAWVNPLSTAPKRTEPAATTDLALRASCSPATPSKVRVGMKSVISDSSAMRGRPPVTAEHRGRATAAPTPDREGAEFASPGMGFCGQPSSV